MRDDQWRDIADRIESTWPGEQGHAEAYRSRLDDLRPEVVEAAIDALLIEHRNEAPSPSALRRAAEGLEAEVPVPAAEEPDTEWTDPPGDAVAAPDVPPPAAPETAAPAPDAARKASGKATLGLILGIAGFITVPLIVATAAIFVSRAALRDVRAAGPGTPGEGRAQTGMILGWIALALYAVVIAVSVAAS